MPIHCPSVALFCSPKNNIQKIKILWTFCFLFNASEVCWTVVAACANYNSNAASLLELHSAAFMYEMLACVCVCRTLRGPWPTSDAPIILAYFAARCQGLSWGEHFFLQWNLFFSVKSPSMWFIRPMSSSKLLLLERKGKSIPIFRRTVPPWVWKIQQKGDDRNDFYISYVFFCDLSLKLVPLLNTHLNWSSWNLVHMSMGFD